MKPSELSRYECQPKKLGPRAWYYHTLGKYIELEIDLIPNAPINHLSIKIPLQRILRAELKGRAGK